MALISFDYNCDLIITCICCFCITFALNSCCPLGEYYHRFCCFTDGPDSVSVSPENSTYVLNESQVITDIVCIAECFPSCSYIWKKNRTAFTAGSKLSLGNLTRQNSGVYTCTVGNSDTSIQTTISHDVTVSIRCTYYSVFKKGIMYKKDYTKKANNLSKCSLVLSSVIKHFCFSMVYWHSGVI